MSKDIQVTKPSLAPLDEFIPYLKTIWETGVMTHNGPLVTKLEEELAQRLKVKNVVCVSSGASALQLAIQALDVKGEVITTPFTYIATANAIAWEHCRPVFVDISPRTLNMDVSKIEEKITEKTTAILPVHVFSAPCDMKQIQAIAARNDLKVIYDAAHAMSVESKGRSILGEGDISALSFNATKLFNTAEGGACITDNDEVAKRLKRLRFFGFDEEKNIVDAGINAKMSELHAALGLANLKSLEDVKKRRREKHERYTSLLKALPFLRFQEYDPEAYNYSYMPLLFEEESWLLRVMARLNRENIYPRRYFFPSLNTLPIFRRGEAFPHSEQASRTTLCLPLYDTLSLNDIERICHSIRAL